MSEEFIMAMGMATSLIEQGFSKVDAGLKIEDQLGCGRVVAHKAVSYAYAMHKQDSVELARIFADHMSLKEYYVSEVHQHNDTREHLHRVEQANKKLLSQVKALRAEVARLEAENEK
jgi:hypothetical protein